jgi:hypothetical protein
MKTPPGVQWSRFVQSGLVVALGLLATSNATAQSAAGKQAPAVAQASEKTTGPVVVGLDHIPLAVEDLDTAAALFRALGFALKPGRPHSNGIRTQNIKFPNGTSIELTTTPAARDRLTTQYRKHLAKGDGPAYAGLYAPSMERVLKQLDGARVGYLRESELLTFPESSGLDYLFIGPRGKSPTDKPEHFNHANTAEALIGLWLASENPSAELNILRILGADVSTLPVDVPDRAKFPVARFAEGEVIVLPGIRQELRGRRIIGATIRVRSLATVQKLLAANKFEVPPARGTREGRSLFVPARMTYGMWIEFRELR